MACPDPNRLQALFDGDLTPADRQVVLDHTDGCEDCRRLLAAVAREHPAPGSQVSSQVSPLAATVETPGGARDASPFAATVAGSAAPAERAGLLVCGSRVGRYEVESFLGAGGLGVVYAARDPELGRRVALKLLKVDPRRDGPGAQARLVREAQAMARVSHPNVLPVYDVGQHGDRVFLAMEIVEGTDLRGWLRERPRSVREIVDAFRAAGEGLAAAHAAGLVHRDFKPDNVLVSAGARVRVTDFGLARAADADESDDAGAIVGTPAYMAPEQHEGRHTDARTDQFAYCVALYEALHGERPFAGASFVELREAVLAGRIPHPRRGSRVPATLRRIVVRGLGKRPGDRWPTMEALLAALGRDRAKVARWIAVAAVGLLAVVVTAAAADWVMRSRVEAGTRASFAATRGQIGRALASRDETFANLSDLSMQAPIMREAAAARDQADFGLGATKDDRKQFASLHAALRDADWAAWSTSTRSGELAVADYKGRLIFSTGDRDAFNGDVKRIAAVAEVYRAGGARAAAQVMRADTPDLVTIGLLRAPRRGLVVVLARASVMAGVPQATFIQLVAARSLLADLTPGSDVRLALVAPDGSADGDVAVDLVRAAVRRPGVIIEARHAGNPWLIQAHPVPGLDPTAPPVAMLVAARPLDVGLTGLFPAARTFLLVTAVAAAAALAFALWRLLTA